MAQHPVTDAFQEYLTLYALGVLAPETAATIETYIRARGLSATRELQTIEHVVGALGYGTPAARPRPELRQRLLDRIAPASNASCSSK
ncbi:MAG: hypothetical protein ETSY2_00555 [Candidatus Entotheonella gemina]|uniref:Uncharacterized protein n=1 Tax=Candidatus Entotheonella gemina TaxID=1429439 RepID=W4MG11_9BACT|nr:MAG: hypothetical protein ETSY2_00555 [Candidatus Entotheonella gemina]